MKIGAIILSRYSSTRLPGKALKRINGKEVLQYIIERIEKVIPKEDIVIATSLEKSDDIIEDFTRLKNINCYRGSLLNVANRFYCAAKTYEFDFAIRINGDNLFVDLPLLKKMKSIALLDKYDFISNVKNRTYPKGMSIEIVRLSHFNSLLPKIETVIGYKEHVTLYMYENEQKNYFFVYNTQNIDAYGIQMALDTEDDFIRSKNIISNFDTQHWKYNLNEIIQIWKKLENEKSI